MRVPIYVWQLSALCIRKVLCPKKTDATCTISFMSKGPIENSGDMLVSNCNKYRILYASSFNLTPVCFANKIRS